MFVCLHKYAKQCCDATNFDCDHCAGQRQYFTRLMGVVAEWIELWNHMCKVVGSNRGRDKQELGRSSLVA